MRPHDRQANNNAIAREVTNGRYDVVVTVSTPTLQAIANANVNIPTGSLYGKERVFAVQSTGQLQDAAEPLLLGQLRVLDLGQ